MNVALRAEPLNILSICTGGAGLDLGVELAIPDARTVCMVEREAFSVATLVSAMEQGLLHPAPVWSDARTFDGRAWRGAVDGLIGGIPCQPHSLAGRKQGSNDARDLWSTARRIIVQSRAWFVVIENVGGMLSAGADEIAGAQRVFRDLSKLGFQVEGGLFTASEVGASHQRERIIILAVADALGKRGRGGYAGRQNAAHADAAGEGMVNASGIGRREGRSEPELWGRRDTAASPSGTMGDSDSGASKIGEGHALLCGRWAKQPARSGAAGGKPNVVHSIGGRRAGRAEVAQRRSQQRVADEWSSRPTLFPPGPDDIEGWREILFRSPELEPAFRRVADGLASRLDIARVDRLRMLGNGVVPLQAAHAIRSLALTLARRGSPAAVELIRLMEGVNL